MSNKSKGGSKPQASIKVKTRDSGWATGDSDASKKKAGSNTNLLGQASKFHEWKQACKVRICVDKFASWTTAFRINNPHKPKPVSARKDSQRSKQKQWLMKSQETIAHQTKIITLPKKIPSTKICTRNLLRKRILPPQQNLFCCRTLGTGLGQPVKAAAKGCKVVHEVHFRRCEEDHRAGTSGL
jgi:hypothetical protein